MSRKNINRRVRTRDNDFFLSISSIEIIEEDVEIVSLDVSNTDTYIANGYITHNKGTNTHTDFDGPTAPTSVSYSHPSLSWSGGTPDTDSGGITGYDVQIDNNSDFVNQYLNGSYTPFTPEAAALQQFSSRIWAKIRW